MVKKKLLCFVSYYLPGYKSGGPLRTIENMIEHLSDEFDFIIVTRDRDLGDKEGYSQINAGEWQTLDGTKVLYLSPEMFSVLNINKILRNTPHDLLYLNSFFDPYCTIRVLLASRFFRSTVSPIILAPRGEFSEGATNIKKIKKYIYIILSRIIGINRKVIFQASSWLEKSDIIRTLKVNESYVDVAIDLPQKYDPDEVFENNDPEFSDSLLRVIFLSRLSPKKNLDYALRALMEVKANVVFDIYGPKEDSEYWGKCEKLITKLPENIKCNYCGNVMPKDVRRKFGNYDLFFFPTRGENYGHVIAESVSAGTPVLLSDQTPWRNLEAIGLGWELSLSEITRFSEKIDNYANRSTIERLEKRAIVRKAAFHKLADPSAIEENRRLFRKALA